MSTDEETLVKQRMEELKKAKEEIGGEIATTKAILDDFEAKRAEEKRRQEEAEEAERKRKEQEEAEEKRKKEAEEAAERARIAQVQLERKRAARGPSATWNGLNDSDYIYKNFSKKCTCVAVAGDTTLMLYEIGSYLYTSDLITNVHNLLHTRPARASSPDYVAMGSLDRYYIRFANGKTEWVGGSSSLHETLREKSCWDIKSIAFGEDFEDVFIVYTNGGYNYWGCPAGLTDKINARGRRADLQHVSLGPNGEWFLKAQNGKCWLGGTSVELRETFRSKNVTNVFFGDDWSYLVRYN